MALPQISGVVRCAIRGKTVTLGGWANVLHFQYAGGASLPGQTEVALLDPILTRLYSGTVYSGGQPWFFYTHNQTTIEAIDYTPLDGGGTGWSFPKVIAGTATSTIAPECAHVLTLLTAKRGRRYRGRIYLPAVGQAYLGTNGQMIAGPDTAIVAQWNGMASAAAAAQWTPVVASYGHGTLHGVPTTWTPFATPVTLVRMDRVVDVQRRRKL